MRIKLDFDMKIKIYIAVKTSTPYYFNTVKIKGIFFSKKRLLKKYPKAQSIRCSFFTLENSLFSIIMNEINGDELYIIKT